MNYAGLVQDDLANGPGIRVSLFVSGCNRHCKNCYNQEAQAFDYGQPYTSETAKNILELVAKSHCSGLSILGGEPLDQDGNSLIGLIALVQEVHKLGKTVWLWTGYTWQEVFDKIVTEYTWQEVFDKIVTDPEACNMRPYLQQILLSEVDVVVDGPFIEDSKDLSLAFRGSSNQGIIDVKKTLANGYITLVEYMVR